jgi:hypothetical protein
MAFKWTKASRAKLSRSQILDVALKMTRVSLGRRRHLCGRVQDRCGRNAGPACQCAAAGALARYFTNAVAAWSVLPFDNTAAS